MTWRKASERRIGTYVWWDSATESVELLPLLECLSYAIESNRPLDYFLRGILGGDATAPSGGDPGWVLYQDHLEGGRVIYHAFTDPEMSGLDPNEGDYDEWTVKLHVRRALDNFVTAHPDQANEVRDVVLKYGL
jgi:hypothetical protein